MLFSLKDSKSPMRRMPSSVGSTDHDLHTQGHATSTQSMGNRVGRQGLLRCTSGLLAEAAAALSPAVVARRRADKDHTPEQQAREQPPIVGHGGQGCRSISMENRAAAANPPRGSSSRAALGDPPLKDAYTRTRGVSGSYIHVPGQRPTLAERDLSL